MSSPVMFSIRNLIQIDTSMDTPIYLQVVHQFVKAIQLGFLTEGTRLPGTRSLAEALGINRNTLIKSFEDLQAQGWIAILPNKGTFILSDKEKNPRPTQKEIRNQAGFDFRQSSILDNPYEKCSLRLKADDGFPDPTLSESGILARIYASEARKYDKLNLLKAGTAFKEQLLNYLNIMSGIRSSDDNLLITNNRETALYLVAKALLIPNDVVVVGSPGYFSTNMMLLDCGARLVSVRVDDQGLSIIDLEAICQRQTIRMVYLTPNRQYPTTVSLAPKRRVALLELATRYGFVVLEDDYDSQFYYDNNAMMPLISSDVSGMVVYVGSFGQSLVYGFRKGFVLAPKEFIDELYKHTLLLEPCSDPIKDKTLAYWISEGEMYRHQKKTNQIYKERRDYLAQLLHERLSEVVAFDKPNGGLAFWLRWRSDVNLGKLQKKCEKNGLFIPQILLYQNRDLTTTRLGFGSLNSDKAEQLVEILEKSIFD